MRLNVLDWLSLVLVIVGALNWGLVGALNFNLVHFLFGSVPVVESVVYVVVGLAGVWAIYLAARVGNRATNMA